MLLLAFQMSFCNNNNSNNNINDNNNNNSKSAYNSDMRQ